MSNTKRKHEDMTAGVSNGDEPANKLSNDSLPEVKGEEPPPESSTAEQARKKEEMEKRKNEVYYNRRYKKVNIEEITFLLPDGYDNDNATFLGGGSYGNVIRSKVTCNDGKVRDVAIKKLKDPFATPALARRIFREVRLLQLMNHENIIRALDLYTPDDESNFRNVYIVTEYAGDSLYRWLRKQKIQGSKYITLEHVQLIVYQLLRALKYIHSANIIHRDLKPGNLAVTTDSDLTVLDFGLARSTEAADDLTQYVMTRWYRSPEVIFWNVDSYSTQVDMWSVGCIAAELLTGETLFEGEDVNSQYQRITQLCGSPDKILLEKIGKKSAPARTVIESFCSYYRKDFYAYFAEYNPPPELVDFLDKILVLDPDRRMSVIDAMAHPYMADYHIDDDEPTAATHFELHDNDRFTVEQWRKMIFEEIINFERFDKSPIMPHVKF